MKTYYVSLTYAVPAELAESESDALSAVQDPSRVVACKMLHSHVLTSVVRDLKDEQPTMRQKAAGMMTDYDMDHE